jgi:hypothetical protein
MERMVCVESAASVDGWRQSRGRGLEGRGLGCGVSVSLQKDCLPSNHIYKLGRMCPQGTLEG